MTTTITVAVAVVSMLVWWLVESYRDQHAGGDTTPPELRKPFMDYVWPWRHMSE